MGWNDDDDTRVVMRAGYALLALGLLAGGAAVGVLVWLLGFEHAQQLADIANKIALTVATIVGGYWVYDRFVRERIGESRLDLTVSAEAFSSALTGAVYLSVTVGAENVGSEKVDLDHDYCALTVATHEVGPTEEVSGAEVGPEPADEAAWLPLDRVFFVLQEQEAIEPGSSFGDQLLVRLPGKAPASEAGGGLVAARLDLVVQSKDQGYWAATSVVTL